jgi:hypothetical protein
MSNVRASQELISEQMQSLVQSSQIFLVTQQTFPNSLTSNPTQVQPGCGVVNLHDTALIPASLSTALPLSQTLYPALLEVQLPLPEALNLEVQPMLGDPVTRETGGAVPNLQVDELPPVGRMIVKRRRVVPEDQR